MVHLNIICVIFRKYSTNLIHYDKKKVHFSFSIHHIEINLIKYINSPTDMVLLY